MRRIGFGLMAAAIGLGLTTARAQQHAMTIPQGQIAFIVPLAAGGPLDAAARMMAEKLGQRLGRTIIVENRTGAGGNIGAAYVAKAAPDGLTWLYTIDSVLTVNPHLYTSQGSDVAKDLIPAARIGVNTLALVVNVRRSDAKNFAELLAASHKNELNFASAGIGSPGHIAFEYLRMATGIKGVHVPYRGAAPAMQDIVSGIVDAGFVTAGASLPHIESGVLRALAVSNASRSAQLPGVPTAQQAGITGFEAGFANYLLAPAKSDPKMRAMIGEHVKQIMQDKGVQARLISLATEPTFADEAESVARIASDREKWGQVVKAANVKVN